MVSMPMKAYTFILSGDGVHDKEFPFYQKRPQVVFSQAVTGSLLIRDRSQFKTYLLLNLFTANLTANNRTSFQCTGVKTF